jgi:hypothetical protein
MSFLREPDSEPIPGYRLIEPIGSGGFGEVWKCEAPGGLHKAIKFVFGNLNSLDVDGARAEQELKALKRVIEVRHPFILSTEQIKIVEGEVVIVMELADRNLHEAFEEYVQAGLVGIPRDTLLRYIRDAAEALDLMNEKYNLQHLDIKPRNLFLVSDRVKVADFGLVKHLERSGASGILGGVTPLYAAPETFAGNISGRSDQYSLAVVYTELLTGQRPFSGKNARLLAQQHMNEEPELRSLPEPERPVVGRALAKDPNKRFPNCLAFVRALYTAGLQPTREIVLPEMAQAFGKRPVTMFDTMENISLEQLPKEDDSEAKVELDADPPADAEFADISELGITMALPQTGALRPTLIIGIGGCGKRAIMELRGRLLDRFGDLDRLPLLRFLYLDADIDAVKASVRGAPELALKTTEVHHLPLQAVGHYRRRQLDQLNDWLPREKLYCMPRSLKPQGSRALARLAFSDNYLRVLSRIKKEIQKAAHPDTIYASVSQTGLALRDNVPRIYILASACGGGSGMLTDLGYAARRLLQQMRHADATVTGMLFCGAPDDPATPKPEQANLFATLTELNHFSDPSISFSSQYGADGPRLADDGTPCNNIYLLTLNNRTPEGKRDAMAHLGSYLFHELTTPLGIRLDHSRMRQESGVTPFRSLGTYAVWFPRGLLLRLAARQCCQRIMEEWGAAGEPTALAELDAAHARVAADPDLSPELLSARLAELASRHMEAPPGDALTRLLASIEDQSQHYIAQDDPGAWARQAVVRVKEWLGSGLQPAGAPTFQQRKSRLTRALETAAAHLAEEWDLRLTKVAHGLMENPGRRLAIAEEAYKRLLELCNECVEAHQARSKQQAQRSNHAQEQLQTALENCASSANAFTWFGNRTRRTVRVFLDHLTAYARQCLSDDMGAALTLFYNQLHGKLAEHLRDLTFCRQRLRHVQEALQSSLHLLDDSDTAHTGETSNSPTPLATSESFWESIRESATTRVVLPESAADLEHAATQFVYTLNTEQWTQLDQALQDAVLGPLGGLFRAATNTSDLMRHLVSPLVAQAVSTLGKHLPITDVAQVELATETTAEGDLSARLHLYHENALPLLHAAGVSSRQVRHVGAGLAEANGDSPATDGGSGKQHSFLLVPASDAGKKFGQDAKELLPHLHLVSVPGQADLMFCREKVTVNTEDLDRILRSCRTAYEEVAYVPTTSPHSRFDIQEWTPLDP